MLPITEVRNRIHCIVQAMCCNKYKTINPDLTLNDFNVVQQQRMDQLEESILKFKQLNSARIKKGFIMVNKLFEFVDELKHNAQLYRENLSLRKSIISDIKITGEKKVNKNDPIEYATPAVPQKVKTKKKKVVNKSLRGNTPGKKSVKVAQTNTSEIIEKENMSFDRGNLIDLKNLQFSDSYSKLVIDLKEKVVDGLKEDLYNLKTFEDAGGKIETSLWSLKDLFYQCNKELRRTLEQGYESDYAKEIDELEALEAYKSTKEVAAVYQREIKWLKSRNEKLTTNCAELLKKHKQLKGAFRTQKISWDKLKTDNDNLLEVIRELKNDVAASQKQKLSPVYKGK